MASEVMQHHQQGRSISRSTTANSLIMLSQRDFVQRAQSSQQTNDWRSRPVSQSQASPIQTSLIASRQQVEPTNQKRRSIRSKLRQNNDFYQNASARYQTTGGESKSQQVDTRNQATNGQTVRAAAPELPIQSIDKTGAHIDTDKASEEQQRQPIDSSVCSSGSQSPAGRQQQQQTTIESDHGDSIATTTTTTNKQQSVGPVMGIFFKVWSLVKVTKVRHQQNKMRRQNSEDTSQFRYISGDQLAAARSSGSRASQASPNEQNLLQREHFRRAGSQPAPNMMYDSSAVAAATATSSRLQVTPPPMLGSLATATTNSSSSGVSSSSGNLTATMINSNVCEDTLESGCAGSTRPKHEENRRSAELMGSNSSGFRYAKMPSSYHEPVALEDGPIRQTRAQSEAAQDRNASRSRRISAMQQRRATSEEETSSAKLAIMEEDQHSATGRHNNHQAKSTTTRMDQRRLSLAIPSAASSSEASARLMQQEESDENENEIYSTPNDSIQSVSSNPQQSQQQSHEQKQRAILNVQQSIGSQANTMIKSFSTNNFAQLIRQTSSKSKNLINEVPKNFLNNKNANLVTVQSSTRKQQQQQEQTARRSSSNSRFFISSSSSSEESNPPTTTKQHQPDPHELVQTQARVPMNFGVHQHGTQLRPDSMIFRPFELTLPQANMVTPNDSLLCSQPSFASQAMANNNIAAMSPMIPIAQTTTNNNCRLVCPNESDQINQQHHFVQYKKSPSLFEMSHNLHQSNARARLGGKFPSPQSAIVRSILPSHQTQLYSNQLAINNYHSNKLNSQQLPRLKSFFHPSSTKRYEPSQTTTTTTTVPNSISLHDCKLANLANSSNKFLFKTGSNNFIDQQHNQCELNPSDDSDQQYRLTQMLLKFSSDPSAKDEQGNTALMYSIMSENFVALKCIIEHGGIDLNARNEAQQSALDLICSKPPSEIRLDMLRLLIGHEQVNLDMERPSDGTRLLDRLIAEHQTHSADTDKLAYIDCLLHNGAKLGSSTWLAARGKFEIQLRLLKKLCQDGYFLYKKCDIEAAIYRFEYAIRRIDELETQLVLSGSADCCRHDLKSQGFDNLDTEQRLYLSTTKATQQLKYQTYLGLSRCERKRNFLKRALEFAYMSILVDSTSYEGYYSKAHILKDLGRFEEALSTINQSARLVDRSIETIENELSELNLQAESIVLDGCFEMHDAARSGYIEAHRLDLKGNLDYLEEAKKHVLRLEEDIVHERSMYKSNELTAS